MNSLEVRKQLLIAESELNRSFMAQEWLAMADSINLVTGQVRALSLFALPGAVLIASLVALWRYNSACYGRKLS